LKGCFTYEKPSFFASFILTRKILKWKNFQRHCFVNRITARTNGKPSKTANGALDGPWSSPDSHRHKVLAHPVDG